MKYEKISKSHSDTFLLAQTFADHCSGGTVLLLDGDLAAGKTVFAKGLGAGLGVKETIKSPSYTLMCSYQGRLPFVHFDAYNLQSLDDFYALGFDEFLEADTVALIEWASVIRQGFPAPYVHLQIQMGAEENERLLIFTPYGTEAEALLERWWENENTGI